MTSLSAPAFGDCCSALGGGLKYLRGLFWLLPCPWGSAHRHQGRCLSTYLPYPQPLVYSTCVFGDNPLGRIGWWCRLTLWLRLLGILIHVTVHMWPLNLFKKFPGFSLLLSMVDFCSSCHFARNESRCWPLFFWEGLDTFKLLGSLSSQIYF